METNREIWPTHYVPAPHLPEWVGRELELMGGKNPHGEPNYMMVWGMDARTFLNGNPQAIKYPNPNDPDLGYASWMLERWASPEFFNRKVWNEMRYGLDTAGTGKGIDYLGPFPNHGAHILVAPMITEDYRPLPISSQLIDELKRRVHYGAQISSEKGLAFLAQRLRQNQKRERVRRVLDERQEEFRRKKERINDVASRSYVGLSGATLPLANPELMKRTAKLFNL